MTIKDASGTIEDAGAGVGKSTLALDGTRNRQYLFIENPDAAEDLWCRWDGAAAADSPSFKIAAGDHRIWLSPNCPGNSLSVYAAAAGQKYTVHHS